MLKSIYKSDLPAFDCLNQFFVFIRIHVFALAQLVPQFGLRRVLHKGFVSRAAWSNPLSVQSFKMVKLLFGLRHSSILTSFTPLVSSISLHFPSNCFERSAIVDFVIAVTISAIRPRSSGVKEVKKFVVWGVLAFGPLATFSFISLGVLKV